MKWLQDVQTPRTARQTSTQCSLTLRANSSYSTSLILSPGRLSFSFNDLSLPQGSWDSTHLYWWFSMLWLVLRLFGSAVCGCSVLLCAGAALPRLLVSHFDSVQGVVDGGAVSPAPGSWHWVVQHSLDRLHWETVWEWMKGIQRVRGWRRSSMTASQTLHTLFFLNYQ